MFLGCAIILTSVLPEGVPSSTGTVVLRSVRIGALAQEASDKLPSRIIASFIVGLNWGINGVALCYSIAVYIVTIASLWYAGKSAELAFTKILEACYKPIIGCFVTAGILTFVNSEFLVHISLVSSLLIKVFLFSLFYFLILSALYGGFKPLRDIRNLKDLLVKK